MSEYLKLSWPTIKKLPLLKCDILRIIITQSLLYQLVFINLEEKFLVLAEKETFTTVLLKTIHHCPQS